MSILMRSVKSILLKIFVAVLLLPLFSGCHKTETFSMDPFGTFDALWTVIDEHYCFFEYKDIDWNEIGAKYRRKVRKEMSQRELFVVCSDMINELRDGHTNLSSAWDVSHYRFWDAYPQNFYKRIIEENYLNFNYKTTCGIMYGVLPQNFGYMYYPSFEYTIGEGNLDNILNEMMSTNGLIIDVRDNGGGVLLNVETLIGRFISKDIYAGAISHKTGPKHNDFSEPYKYYFHPAENGRIRYLKPIVVLTNRSSYSATNNFASIMKYLPNVRIVGDYTGGGSGLPFSTDLPNGWTIRFSSCSVTDPEGNITEFGVAPSEGCKIDILPEDMAAGRDPIIDKAQEVLAEMINSVVMER